MHELSIALSIVEGVEEELACRVTGNVAEENERVEAVRLRLGPLSGVVKEALLFSFEAAAAGTRLEGCRLEIEDTPVVVYCPNCEAERTAVSAQNLSCSECGAPGGDVRSGAELQVFALELSQLETVSEQRTAAG
jgi:hydrogenase nickel incorporation protein HypA/HybF